MIQYFLSGGILMIPIYLSLLFLIFISIKNLKSAYHIDKIILVGSLTAIFGIISTAVGIRNAWSIAPSFSKIAPHILLHGLKTSLVTTFAGGFILFFSTLSWYLFSNKYKKNNLSTALMIDQRVSQGIKSNFFNEKAFTTTIPAQLIKKFNMPVVPIFIERYEGIKFKMKVHKPIHFSNEDTIENITNELNKTLEKMILANPNNWIWSHNRWK